METEILVYGSELPEKIERLKPEPLLTIPPPESVVIMPAGDYGDYISIINQEDFPRRKGFNNQSMIRYDDYISNPHKTGYESKNIIEFPKFYNHKNDYEPYQLGEEFNTLKNGKQNALVKILTNLVIQSSITSPGQIPRIPNIPASWLTGGNFPSPSYDSHTGAIQPEDLPELALPVLEFMEEVKPHVVIGCDRGGRLFGLAVHAAWRQTRSGQPFPTLDGKLHFARVSKSEDSDIMQEKIDQIIESTKRLGSQRGKELADDEQLRVLFVDDWVIGGGTMSIAKKLTESHGAKAYFAVMCGDGADVTGQPDLQTFVSWHDRPEEIGINYMAAVEAQPDGSYTQKQEVVAVRAPQAVGNRRRIQHSAKFVVKRRTLERVA